ncbi:MAG: transposase [Verrucomicrobia bacterium]|nr:transposase [Verrucomicrobiota bacterium]
MRLARIKIQPEIGEAVYHCMTRVVNGERVIDDVAREVLRKQLWAVADFCGVQILTHAIMSNHFHVLLKVPVKTAPPDAELLRRYQLLHPKPTKYQTERLDVIKAQLATGGHEAETWRARQLALMGDVSAFMKLVKQRFATWFNKSHNRYGALFAERFKSVLIEPQTRAIQTIALYIDLNCVRAGLVQDPKDYRFCGYGEAVAGNKTARAGLCAIHGPSTTWADAHAAHREALFGTGTTTKQNAQAIAPAAFEKVLKQKGRLPLATVLRCRVRYFTDGAVLGSQAFVETHLAAYRERHGARERTAPRPLAPITDWGGLTALRGLRKNAFG